MSINERFGKIIRALYGGNKSAFATAVGIAPSVVDNIVGKRQGKPSFEVIEKVSALAEVNITWLITGRGEPFDFRSEEEKKKANYFLQDSSNSTPLLQIIKEKDIKIIEQAEEIGRLKERIAQLEREKGKDASGVSTSGVANAG